jgi:hypothetical protein
MLTDICVLTMPERWGWPNPWLYEARGAWERQPGVKCRVSHAQRPHAFARNRAADTMLSAKPMPDVFVMIDNDVVPEIYGRAVNVPAMAALATPTRIVIAPVMIYDRRAIAVNCWRYQKDQAGWPLPDKPSGAPCLQALTREEILESESTSEKLLDIDGGGFGAVAIHRDTLIEAMGIRNHPFRTLYFEDGSVKVSEDIEFCLFAKRELGVQTVAAFGYCCDHLRTTPLFDLALTRAEIEESIDKNPRLRSRAGDEPPNDEPRAPEK